MPEKSKLSGGAREGRWAKNPVGWSGCALIGDPGKRRCGVVEKWVYFRRDLVALAPRAGAQSAEPPAT